STLLNELGILDAYDSGSYELGDVLVKDLTEARAAELRNKYVGFVFQSFHLLPYKNATENVALPLYYAGIPRRERFRRANELLERVGLGDRADHLPNQLSGGQKQRVAIARSLVTNPRLLLADEPTGALDSATSKEIMDLLVEVNRAGTTVVVVTHESVVADRCPRRIRLVDGLIAEDQHS
ncbi:MAG: ABC transporter ATP-binding protein, partial [Alphaproteobacteria bacterium]|nr:ABC transporter ATP-binding protein [Alphaproteobacteria bacterium]